MNNLIYTLTYLTVASAAVAAAEILSEDKTNDKISLLRSRNLLDHIEQTLEEEPSTSTTTHTKQRELEWTKLSGTNCWYNTDNSPPTAQWYPVYSQGWQKGSCKYHIDCNSGPGYDTELDCCKGAYPDQSSGYCLSQLPNPPTLSPTDTGGLDVYYPDYNAQWSEAYCINTRQGIVLNSDGTPRDRPSYSSMLECCKRAYAGQMSGKCISMLPEEIRPTASPTNADRTADFWYAMYDMSWGASGCSNKLPLPYNNVNDRPNYSTGEECCAKEYRGQTSQACVCEHLDTPQLGCPGIIEYVKTIVNTVVTSTISFGAITVPTEPGEKAALVSSLEDTIKEMLALSLGDDLKDVVITKIDGVAVRRLLRNLDDRLLSGSADIEFDVVFETIVDEGQDSDNGEESTSDVDAAAVAVQVADQLTPAVVEAAIQSSDNPALSSVTVEGVSTDENPVTTSSTETVVGTAGPTASPSSSPSKGPTNSPLPPTTSPTHSPSLSPSKVPTNSPSKSPSSSPTSVPSYSQQPSSQPSSQPSMSLEPSLAPSSCTNFITVNENTQDAETLPNDWVSPPDYTPPTTCGTSGSDSCQCGIPVSTTPGCTEFPIGGSGMVDEGFTMLTLPNGNQVGIRAVERNVGVTNVNPTAAGDGVGSYEVQTGSRTTSPDDNAWWNIDWHVDLRPGGNTITDYLAAGGLRMTAKCISGSGSGCDSFGSYDFDLAPATYVSPPLPSDWDTYASAFGATNLGTTFYGDEWNLLQASQNPDFNIWPWSPLLTGDPVLITNSGLNEFDKDAEATYKFCLLLGDECPVCMEVVAS